MVKGKIRDRERYARAKMLDHSSWQLPRGITPSDGDMIFDNNGVLLFCELKEAAPGQTTISWGDIGEAQRRLYSAIVQGGKVFRAAILLHKKPENEADINTRNDIISFQLLKGGEDGYPDTSRVYSGKEWPNLVEKRFYISLDLFDELFDEDYQDEEYCELEAKGYEDWLDANGLLEK